MYLSKLVIQYINNPKLRLYDLDGNLINYDKLIKEYSIIKNYLLSNFTTTQIVGISLKKDYKYLLLILASIEIGLTYVPMNNDWPKNRIKQIESIASVTITIDDNLLINILDLQKSYFIKNTFNIYDEKPLYIIFTSGSTGEPKGVVIKRESAENFFKWANIYFQDINSSDNLLQLADFSFDMSVLDIGMLLTKQLGVYFSKFNSNIFELAYEIEQYKISLISTVPNNINMLLSNGVIERVNLDNLKNIFIGGARFSYGLYQKLLPYKNINIYNFYGPTEVTVYALVKKMHKIESKDTHNHNISIGTATSNVKIKIMNLHENEGELYLGGIQVMKEYISDPKKTNEVISIIDQETYYKTGDIVFVDNKNEYYIVGRLDDTIKRRGYRINLQDIDSYIHKIDSVIECTTIAIPDEIHENRIITFLHLKNDDDILKVKNEFKNILTTYQIPDKLIKIDKFPTNNSGKICKKTLKEMFLNKTIKG